MAEQKNAKKVLYFKMTMRLSAFVAPKSQRENYTQHVAIQTTLSQVLWRSSPFDAKALMLNMCGKVWTEEAAWCL